VRHTNCKHAYALRHAMVTPEYDAAVRQPPPGWLAWSFERSLRWSTKKNKWVKDFARYAVETHDALARAALAGGRGNRYGYEHVREVNPSCVALDVECTVPDSNAAEATDAAASRYAAACARLGMSFSNLAALGDAMLEPILRALEEALPALRGAATLVSTAHGPDDGKYKYSFHVKYPGFKLPTQEARTRFGKRLKALEPLVDASVYSANHLMRMLGSAKRGSTRVLVPRGAGPEHEPSVEEVVQHMWCFVPPDTLELPLDDEQDDAPGPSDGAVPAKRPKRSAGAQKAAGKLAPELEAALLEVVATAPPPLRMRPVFQSTAMDDAEITVTCDYAGGSYVCPCGDEHDSNSARLRIKRSDGAVTFNCFHRGTGKFHAIGAVPRRLLPPQALTGVAAWYADVLRRVGLTPLWFDDARVERMARYDAFYRDARFVDAEGPCPVCGAEHGRYVVCTHVKRRGAGMVRTCILTWAVNDAAKTCLVQPDVQSDLAWVRRTHPDAEPWQLDELSKCLKFGMPLTPLEEVPPVAAAGATA
jgi:hypothetical protein